MTVPKTPEVPAGRLMSIDAYRGLVMLAMASGGLGLAKVAARTAEETWWDVAARQFEHVEWHGCTFWDLIQPSFMFLVGVALPFSHVRRRAQGESLSAGFGHALWRSLLLVVLGVYLASNWEDRTNFTFTNVLAQIGLGYWFVYLLVDLSPAVQIGVALAVLAVHWGFFASYPRPPANLNLHTVGVHFLRERLAGFAEHWEMNTNAAAAFDRWFLNLFPRAKPFDYNPGGYTTLNFIPSIATMIFGVVAGGWLRSDRPGKTKVFGLALTGALCLVVSTALAPVNPVVKRIWSPGWVVYSTAWTCWLLAFFYGTIDVLGYRRWAFPLVVVGLNSIAMYLMAQLLKGYVRQQLQIHVGTLISWLHTSFRLPLDQAIFGSDPLRPAVFGGPYGPIIESTAVLLVLWGICLWMYSRKIFLKI
jgi:predicted acyltransferase